MTLGVRADAALLTDTSDAPEDAEAGNYTIAVPFLFSTAQKVSSSEYTEQ